MGMLERIREPSRPPLGVAPPGALRPGVDGFSLDGDDDELLASRRRNCSLFMVTVFAARHHKQLTLILTSRMSGLAHAHDKIKEAYRLQVGADNVEPWSSPGASHHGLNVNAIVIMRFNSVSNGSNHNLRMLGMIRKLRQNS